MNGAAVFSRRGREPIAVTRMVALPRSASVAVTPV
jgi:hypothetical protein